MNKKNRITVVLNVLGLTVAFAAFMVIVMQVRYDLGFDKHYQNADRLYRIEGAFDELQPQSYSAMLSRAFGQELLDNVPEFEKGGAVNAVGTAHLKPTGTDMDMIQFPAVAVSASLLDVLEVELLDGTVDAFEQPKTLLICQSWADKLYPGESAVGKTLSYGSSQTDEASVVVGVYKDFSLNSFLPNGVILSLGDAGVNDPSEWSFPHYVLLSEGAMKDSAQVHMNAYVKSKFMTSGEETLRDWSHMMRLNSLHSIYYSPDVTYDYVDKGNKTTTYSLITIAFLLIAIAIINFVNFSMASVPMNIRNINTRKILGCANSALIINQIIRAVGTALIGFVLALACVWMLEGTSFASFISGSMSLVDQLPLVVLSLFIALLTGVLAGVYPAFYSTSFSPALVLKGSFSLSPKGRMLRTALIGFQYVISFVLIIVALFINVQSRFMKKHDMGFRSNLVLTMRVPEYASSQSNLDAVAQALKQTPGIAGVAFADGELVSNGKMGWGRTFKDQSIHFDCFPVSTNFLDFFGIEVIDGRGFVETDAQKENGTIIFNETATKVYPSLVVGEKISGHVDEPADIVGVVKDFNFQPLQYRINPIALYVFGTQPWRPQSLMYIRIAPENIVQKLQTIRDVAAPFMEKTNMSSVELNFMNETIGKLYIKEDRLGYLIMLFSFLSVFISLIGILGLIAFDTQFRRKEMGIRRVLGSTIGQILTMLNTAYLKITIVCFVISIPIALFIIKSWVRGFPYQAPVSVWIFAVSLLVLIAMTVLVITLQSYRTVSSNPVDSIAKD